MKPKPQEQTVVTSKKGRGMNVKIKNLASTSEAYTKCLVLHTSAAGPPAGFGSFSIGAGFYKAKASSTQAKERPHGWKTESAVSNLIDNRSRTCPPGDMITNPGVPRRPRSTMRVEGREGRGGGRAGGSDGRIGERPY